jgi:alginate O-acetyltransferase complex protein AlgI
MLFNSYSFVLVFLPLALAGFYLLARRSTESAATWLGFASLGFYAYWSLAALPVLLLSIFGNYFFNLKIADETTPHRRRWLMGAILTNLALLFYYKYANFAIQNVNAVLSWNHQAPLDFISVILPIGISFFTFTQIVFLLDSYQGIAREAKFSHYLLFVTFFPHLISGPVIHHKQMMPQFADEKTYRFNPDKFSAGLTLFALGMAKKILLADPLGGYADVLFNSIGEAGSPPHLILSWFGSLAYTFQMYFDFSGYSDMAVGISLLFGITLPINFDAPFRATSMIDYWQRWHMSLTRYIGQYLYNPLTLMFTRIAMAKPAALETLYSLVIPTLLVFLIVGLWHGASWTFVAFGAMNGLFLIVNHLWRKATGGTRKKKTSAKPSLSNIAGWSLTFLCLTLCFVMFRAHGVAQALSVYKGMLGLNGIVWPHSVVDALGLQVGRIGNIWGVDDVSTFKYVLMMAVSFGIVFLLPSTARLTVKQKNGFDPQPWLQSRWAGLAMGLLFAVSMLALKQNSPFLYFQF